MNTTLFKSPWAIVGLLISALFVAWPLATGAPFGARGGSDVDLVLWSGWITLALMVVVCLYSLRKFAHRLGISPEFRWKVPQASLEEAERRLNEIRGRVQTGILTDRAEVEQLVDRVLREEGIRKVCRADVTETGSQPPLMVRVSPTEPLGRMARWLHFHVYLGLASGVVLFVHGGASLQSPLGAAMNVLAAIVILTGIVGAITWAFGPTWMTSRERDLTVEEAWVRQQSLTANLERAVEPLQPEQARLVRRLGMPGLGEQQATAAVAELVATSPEDERDLVDIATLATQRRLVQTELAGMERVKRLLNWWRLLHIPATILLLLLSLVHVWSVWRW